MKATIKGHMVKFGTSGLGIADLADRGFVYFTPRHLPNYQGETTRELVSQGYKPGRPLDLIVDVDSSGQINEVTSVKLTDVA